MKSFVPSKRTMSAGPVLLIFQGAMECFNWNLLSPSLRLASPDSAVVLISRRGFSNMSDGRRHISTHGQIRHLNLPVYCLTPLEEMLCLSFEMLTTRRKNCMRTGASSSETASTLQAVCETEDMLLQF